VALTPDVAGSPRARRLELRELLTRKTAYLDRTWDIVFWITAAFLVGGAADITRNLFAGDWDFWVDWKDRQWWPILTPFAMIIIPSAIQYVLWLVWRMPLGATFTAVCLFVASWIGRVFFWQDFAAYPLTLMWPATIVPAGILLDVILLKTRSFVLTSVLGGIVFTFAFWVANHVSVAPYLQATSFMGHVLTVADVEGIQYLRTQTPEYLRMVENGTLRSFLDETRYVSLVFGSTVAIAGYWIGQALGRWIAIWPVGRGIKRF
jgi:methane/ammonia monooxygenase subunit A